MYATSPSVLHCKARCHFFLFKQDHQKNSRFKICWKLFIKKEYPLFLIGLKCHRREVVLDLQATFKCLYIQCYKKSIAQAQLERARHRRQTRSLWQRGTCFICWAARGWKEADNKGLTHLKCRSKLSQGFSLWRYLTAAITFLFHVSIDFNSRSCNSCCNLFSS